MAGTWQQQVSCLGFSSTAQLSTGARPGETDLGLICSALKPYVASLLLHVMRLV